MHDDEIFDQDGFGGGRPDRAGHSGKRAEQAPTPWVLSPDMGYGYDKDGKTYSYKMGTSNAKELLKGAKKVPKGTLFFIGENGQLYMRAVRTWKATANSSSGRDNCAPDAARRHKRVYARLRRANGPCGAVRCRAIRAFTRVFDARYGPACSRLQESGVPALRSGMKNAAPRPGHGD